MRNIIPSLFLVLIVLSTSAHAMILNAPFPPEIDSRFNALEGVVSPGSTSFLLPEVGNTGLFVQREAKAVMNMAVVAGTYPTQIVLPAKSLITQAFVFFESAITPSGTTTAIQCVGANDILSATDETGVAANGLLATIETGLAAPMLYTSTGCTVKVVTAVHTGTAGKIDIFVKYVSVK